MSEFQIGEDGAAAPGPAEGGFHITRREWLLLAVLSAVQFTHIVDFMIVMPLESIFHEKMGLTPYQHGLVVAAYTLSAGMAAVLAARFLDRFDRKTALLALYAGFGVGTFLCAVTPEYYSLLAARTVAGAFGGVAAAVVVAIIGDTFPGPRRATAMGIIMSAFSLASIAGVPVGLELATAWGWHAPFAVLAGISVVVWLVAAAILPPLRGHFRDKEHEPASTWQVFADANHLRAFALTAALVFTTFSIAPFMPAYLEYNVGIGHDNVKYLYFFGGAATVVTLTIFGRLSDRFGKLKVFRMLALTTVIPLLLLTNLPAGLGLVLVFAVTTLFMVLTSGRMVPAMALITASSAPAYRGSFMSLNAAVQHIGAGLAASMGGALLQHGEDQVLSGFPLVGLLGCAATLLSLYLAGHLRTVAGGELAPDSDADPATEQPSQVEGEAPITNPETVRAIGSTGARVESKGR
jgi:MFS transporter, DHA1 family, inner membrane transport protein